MDRPDADPYELLAVKEIHVWTVNIRGKSGYVLVDRRLGFQTREHVIESLQDYAWAHFKVIYGH